MMDQAIISKGASARAAGLTVFDNPFLRWESLPATTGETIEEWQAKQSAWDFGWKAEDAIRA